MTNGQNDSVRLVSRIQGAYGTAEVAAEGGFRHLPFYEYGVVPSEDLGKDDAIQGDYYSGDIVDGLISLGGSMVVPMGLQSIGWHLAMLFGDPTTTEPSTGNYEHTFRPAGLPSKRFMTIGKSHRDVNQHFVHDSLFYTGFDLSAQKDNQRARLTFNLVGRQEVKGAALDTTPVEYAADQVPVNFTGKISVDGSEAAAITSFSAKGSMAAEADQEAMNGLATAADIDLGEWMSDGSLNARFRDSTFYDLAAAGTLVDLALDYAISATRGITFKFNKARLERSGIPVNGRGVSSSDFNWQIGRPASGAFPFEVVLRNDVATYANPV